MSLFRILLWLNKKKQIDRNVGKRRSVRYAHYVTHRYFFPEWILICVKSCYYDNNSTRLEGEGEGVAVIKLEKYLRHQNDCRECNAFFSTAHLFVVLSVWCVNMGMIDFCFPADINRPVDRSFWTSSSSQSFFSIFWLTHVDNLRSTFVYTISSKTSVYSSGWD